MKTAALVVAAVIVSAAAVITVLVEREAAYLREDLGGPGEARALILYHPSRDAGFSQDLSRALADGLMDAGLAVERATLTGETPAAPEGYALVAVVSNTYWWSPDLPTLRYLDRARLRGLSAVGVIGGAGSTGRAHRVLGDALRDAGATVLDTRSFWLWRPNDEARMDEPNREVAIDLARRFGRKVGERALAF